MCICTSSKVAFEEENKLMTVKHSGSSLKYDT